jgi:hypothetical protein
MKKKQIRCFKESKTGEDMIFEGGFSETLKNGKLGVSPEELKEVYEKYEKKKEEKKKELMVTKNLEKERGKEEEEKSHIKNPEEYAIEELIAEAARACEEEEKEVLIASPFIPDKDLELKAEEKGYYLSLFVKGGGRFSVCGISKLELNRLLSDIRNTRELGDAEKKLELWRKIKFNPGMDEKGERREDREYAVPYQVYSEEIIGWEYYPAEIRECCIRKRDERKDGWYWEGENLC